jgi:hypothetical protein
MDKSEKLNSHNARLIEQKMQEQRQRLEVQRSAEFRKHSAKKVESKGTEIENKHKKEIMEPAEKRASSSGRSSDSVKNIEKKNQVDIHGQSNRLEHLAKTRNLSESQSRELSRKLSDALDKTDPYWQEADRRTKEGVEEFKKNASVRCEFCHVAGTDEHKQWEKELIQKELKAGRVRGKDFDVELSLKHPKEGEVRLDHVDHQKGIITDRKPIAHDETEKQLMKRYEHQRNRHIEAYEHATGKKVHEYRYSIYSSPKDISWDGNK